MIYFSNRQNPAQAQGPFKNKLRRMAQETLFNFNEEREELFGFLDFLFVKTERDENISFEKRVKVFSLGDA